MVTARHNVLTCQVGGSIYAGVDPVDPTATAIAFGSQPTSGTTGVASSNFSLTLNGDTPPGLVISIAVSSGTRTPTTLSDAGTFTITPSADGVVTVTITNNQGLTNPSPAAYTASTATATAMTLSGPSAGTTGVASSNFTVGLNGATPGGLTITMDDNGGGGTFTPTTLSAAGTFTYTPASDGAKSIGITDNQGLTDPSDVTYTASASGTPTAMSVDFILTSASSATKPYAFGHAFKEGDVPTGTTVDGTGTAFQCSPLTYWPDGSLKHAIIAGRAAVTASDNTITLTNIATPTPGTALTTADLKTAMSGQSCEIDCGAFGSVSWATTDFDSPHTVIATGEVMSSWMYRKAMPSDSHLVGWIEVRLFDSGAVEVFPWIENGYLLVASPTNKSETYTFDLGGTERFSASIDIKHHTRIPLITGGDFSYWLGTDPAMTPKHDVAYLMATKLVPTFGWDAPGSTRLNALQQTYAPNDLAGGTNANGGTGGSGGVILEEAALYLTSGADVRAYKAMLAAGFSAGSWSCHYRDTTHYPIAFSDHPNTSTTTAGGPTIPSNSGGSNVSGPALSHTASYAFLQYLTTSRHWFLEELHFWTTYAYLATNFVNRNYSDGWHLTPQPRARAWSLNLLAQSAAITPSAHPLTDEFVASWEANMEAHKEFYVTGATGSGAWVSPAGLLGDYSGAVGAPSLFPPAFSHSATSMQTTFTTAPDMDPARLTTGGVVKVGGVTQTYGVDWTVTGTSVVFGTPPGSGAAVSIYPFSDGWWGSAYQQNYLMIVFGYASDIGIPQSSPALADHIAVRDHAYTFIVGRAGDGLGGNFNWRHFIAFGMPIGEDNDGLPPESWYDLSETYAELIGGFGLSTLDPAAGGALKAHTSDIDLVAGNSSSTYGATALAALAYAVDHGATGALAGFQRVTTASNYTSTFDPFFPDEYSRFGVVPRLATAYLPSWLPAPGTIGNVTTNTINDVKGSSSPGGIFAAWSGAAWAPWYGTYGSMIFQGGGHGDGNQTDVYRWDVETQLLSKIKATPTIYNYDEGGGNVYCADSTTGWLWGDTSGSTTQTGEPFTSHFYSFLIALPESAMSGGATNGWLYTPGRGSMPTTGQRGTTQAHKLRMGIDSTWTFQGTATGFGPGRGFAIHDTLRNRVWSLPSGTGSVINYRDLDDDSSGSLSCSPGSLVDFYMVGGYHTAEDLLMYARMESSTLTFRIIDPSTGTTYAPSTTGTAPTGTGGAWDWSDTWDAWAYYPRDAGSTVYFLKSGANPRTDTWTWSSQSITGTSRASDGAEPAYNRLRHCPALGNVLLWAPSYNNYMQAIHLTSAP